MSEPEDKAPETPETAENEEIEVVAHDVDEEENPGCIINNSHFLT